MKLRNLVLSLSVACAGLSAALVAPSAMARGRTGEATVCKANTAASICTTITASSHFSPSTNRTTTSACNANSIPTGIAAAAMTAWARR